MRKQYSLTLNCTREEAARRLKMQMSPNLLGGKVQEHSFKIPKRRGSLLSSRGILRSTFCFYGEYRQTGTQTEITYQVRPHTSVVTVCLVLGLVFGWMILGAIRTGQDIFFAVFFCVSFSLIFSLFKYLEMMNCIADFEKQMKREIPRYE